MRGIIVYESMFGSTRTIAEAIARGISDFAETSVVRASEVGGFCHLRSRPRRSRRAHAWLEHVETEHPEGYTGLREQASPPPRTRARCCGCPWSARMVELTGSAHDLRRGVRYSHQRPSRFDWQGLEGNQPRPD